jgi:SAM-dependent methyltransferase
VPDDRLSSDDRADVAAFYDAHPRVYDAAVAGHDDPDQGDATGGVAFYRDLAARADGPALEVGVGTGRVYLELLAAGLDVDGVDVSTGMLRRLREKAAARGLDPTVWAGDVTDLAVDREYGLVYLPFRAFNHLATLADQRAALERVHHALAPGGRLALATFVPGFEFVAERYGEPEETVVTVDGHEYRQVSVTTLTDPVEQVATMERTVYRDGDVVAEGAAPLALVPKRAFELLFERAGFADWTVYGGFDREPLTDPGQEMVWVAER